MRETTTTLGTSLAEIEAVYRHEAQRFTRVATAIVGNEDEAWEVVQDAIASVVRGRDQFRGDGSVSSWIWAAVVNAARSRRRRGHHHERLNAMDDAEQPGPGPGSDSSWAVREAVSKLPERQRLILFLRYYAELTYEEISAVVGVSAGTVGPTLGAALQALRVSLERADL